MCKACAALRARQRRAADPDKYRERERARWPERKLREVDKRKEWHRSYYESHKDAVSERSRRWAQANLDKVRESQRQWRQRNPDKVRASAAIRRARKRNSEVLDAVEVGVLGERDGWICALCEEPVDPALEWPDPWSRSVEHTIPLAAGGDHSYANTKSAHLLCNLKKGDR